MCVALLYIQPAELLVFFLILYFSSAQAGVKALVSAPNFKTSDYYAMILENCPELESAQPGALKSSGYVDGKLELLQINHSRKFSIPIMLGFSGGL